MNRYAGGVELVPGWNVDEVDIAAGLRQAAGFGYSSSEHQMVAEYALMRHARGEEDGAQRTALHGGIDLTSWYATLAAAITSTSKSVRGTAPGGKDATCARD